MRRVAVPPAAVGSFALHGAVALAVMISWGSRDLKVGAVVPVTIVSSAPDADTRPAELAADTQTALTEAPVLDAPPLPTPEPVPPAPTPKAAQQPTRAPQKAFDLDALAASLTRPARNNPQRSASAAKGPSRAETATTARQTTGSGLAAGAVLEGLAEELQRRWNPNCDVEGGRDVVVRVTFVLGIGGQVLGEVVPQIQGPRSSVAQASAERAVRAVYAAAPFRGLPKEFYGDRVAVNFNAREACAR
jgi:periplasmic protein TonB